MLGEFINLAFYRFSFFANRAYKNTFAADADFLAKVIKR